MYSLLLCLVPRWRLIFRLGPKPISNRNGPIGKSGYGPKPWFAQTIWMGPNSSPYPILMGLNLCPYTILTASPAHIQMMSIFITSALKMVSGALGGMAAFHVGLQTNHWCPLASVYWVSNKHQSFSPQLFPQFQNIMTDTIQKQELI